MVPEKAIESTVGALFGHGEDRGHQKHRHRDREESTKSRCIKTKREMIPTPKSRTKEWEK